MKREDLQALGLAQEAIDGIMKLHNADVEANKEEATKIAKKHEEELKASNMKVEELTQSIKKFEGVDIDKLKEDVKTWEDKYKTDLANEKKGSAIRLSILESGVKNEKAIKGFIDDSIIKLNEDGTVVGLKEQLDNIKKENPYLFSDTDDSSNKSQVKLDGGSGDPITNTTGSETLEDAIGESLGF